MCPLYSEIAQCSRLGVEEIDPNQEDNYVTSVIPMHARVGKPNYNSILTDKAKIEPRRRHFEYLLELEEV